MENRYIRGWEVAEPMFSEAAAVVMCRAVNPEVQKPAQNSAPQQSGKRQLRMKRW